ncbi:MAG: DUF1003 domain-containing protein [Agriterribacter sp.]
MKNVCSINKKQYPEEEIISGGQLRKPLRDFIKNQHPDFDETSNISLEAVQEERKKYIENLIKEDIGDITEAEKEVIGSIAGNEILSENIDVREDKTTSFGERLADKVAAFGGSWTFISIFFLILLCWMGLNVIMLHNKGFDPYPFILLNLVLSCLAAIQAPIIMMSQNRQEAKDRERGEHDYKINLKAELEIRMLHEKIDHLLLEQNKKLLELQQTQNEMFNQIAKRIDTDKA